MRNAARQLLRRKLLTGLALLALGACAGSPESRPVAEVLAACPPRPNCVSSQATDSRHQVAPLRLRVAPDQAWAAALEAVDALPRTRRQTTSSRYVHAISRTLLLRFTDDLELVLDEQRARIDVRSASRVGYGDLGVNRRRVERLRAILIERGIVE